jgi:hypothetical protein
MGTKEGGSIMPKQGQEDKKSQELLADVLDITHEASLRKWEQANRDRLMACQSVWPEFNDHWTKVTGNPYFQPITTIADIPQGVFKKEQSPGRINPKSKDYKTVEVFKEIIWEKRLQSIGSKKKRFTFFTLKGLTLKNGTERIIAQNIRPERVSQYIGKKLADQIRSDAKTKSEGRINKLELKVEVEGFWEVIFAPRGSKEDPLDVTLNWEGQCLQMQRNVPVILPGHYLEVADNATYPVYIQTPEQSRKITGHVQFFPYTVLREATYEEYLAMKREGDRITRETRRKEEQI